MGCEAGDEVGVEWMTKAIVFVVFVVFVGRMLVLVPETVEGIGEADESRIDDWTKNCSSSECCCCCC